MTDLAPDPESMIKECLRLAYDVSHALDQQWAPKLRRLIHDTWTPVEFYALVRAHLTTGDGKAILIEQELEMVRTFLGNGW